MNKKDEEVEIDLPGIVKRLWTKKWFIFRFGLLGAVVGVLIAFSIPKEYTTSVIIVTESPNSSSSNMGALASLAGINLNASNSDVFSPEIYPEVLNSTPFLRGLLYIRVIDNTQNIDTTLYEYLKTGQKKSWWSYIFQIPSLIINLFTSNAFSNDLMEKDKYFLSQEDIYIMNYLRSMYSINTDKKTALTTLEVTSQSPKISAFLADTITSYLQSYIIDKRTKKAKMDLFNSEMLYEQAKSNYYKSQQSLALFVDGNQNVISAKYKINQERLQNEVNLSYSVYHQMAQQVQMNIIKVQDDTPIFTVIQPAVATFDPAKPSKIKIIFVCIIISLFISSILVFRKQIIELIVSNN